MCTPVHIIGGAALAYGAIKGTEAIGRALTPDIPAPPPAPGEPARAIDPKVQGSRAREQDRTRALRGRQSTILTGQGGLTAPPTSAPKTLLGQ